VIKGCRFRIIIIIWHDICTSGSTLYQWQIFALFHGTASEEKGCRLVKQNTNSYFRL